uniref:Uncharacterized protein n=1 Tax=Rhizophora mucronata TaxID=61149 RepID=A0A2P2R3Y6_RHIMU
MMTMASVFIFSKYKTKCHHNLRQNSTKFTSRIKA